MILYIVLVSAFFGWGLFNQKRERRRHPSSTEPLLNVADDGEFDIDNLRKNEKLVAKVDLDLLSSYILISSDFVPFYSMPFMFSIWICVECADVLVSRLLDDHRTLLVFWFGELLSMCESNNLGMWNDRKMT